MARYPVEGNWNFSANPTVLPEAIDMLQAEADKVNRKDRFLQNGLRLCSDDRAHYSLSNNRNSVSYCAAAVK